MIDDARSCVVIMTVMSAAVIHLSVVWQPDANNQYNQIGRSNFLETESRIDSNRFADWIELNRFESQIGIL